MTPKDASSQAGWALLTEGVTAARLELHRLQHLINRALALVQESEQRDHLYQVAGDIIKAIPRRLEQAETHLDRTSYALTKMGEDFLNARLSISDKTLVEEAVDPAFGGFSQRSTALVQRVAARYLLAQRLRSIKAMQVSFGLEGLDKTWQAPFPPTTKCLHCGGEARIGFVAHERIDEEPYPVTTVSDLHQNEPRGEGLWLHDACAVAVYFCRDCLEASALYNQG